MSEKNITSASTAEPHVKSRQNKSSESSNNASGSCNNKPPPLKDMKLPFPGPLRRGTHAYCPKCRINLQEYGSQKCDQCGALITDENMVFHWIMYIFHYFTAFTATPQLGVLGKTLISKTNYWQIWTRPVLFILYQNVKLFHTALEKLKIKYWPISSLNGLTFVQRNLGQIGYVWDGMVADGAWGN